MSPVLLPIICYLKRETSHLAQNFKMAASDSNVSFEGLCAVVGGRERPQLGVTQSGLVD